MSIYQILILHNLALFIIQVKYIISQRRVTFVRLSYKSVVSKFELVTNSKLEYLVLNALVCFL